MTTLDGRLVRAADLVTRPVVTIAGEDVAQIKDVVYDAGSGEVVAFTLAGRGMFAGPKHEILLWEGVHGVGPDAVIVPDVASLVAREQLDERSIDQRDVIGARVITDDGRDLGVVTDLIIDVRSVVADAVGYALSPSESFRDSGSEILLPLPDTLAVSGDNLVVPHEAIEYVRNDLAGFGAAVEQFRSTLGGRS